MPQACYTDADLEQSLTGELPADDVRQIETHLLECRACVDRLELLYRVDPILPWLQGPHTLKVEQDNAVVASLLIALRDRSQVSTDGSGLVQTVTGESKPPLDLSEFLARLTPPTSAEELGGLGPFRLHKLLGAGGMGMVFIAEDTGLNRSVALKTLRPELLRDRSAVMRFLSEARAAAKIKHPHVVTVHQVGEINGLPFLVQELLDGESLDTRLTAQGKVSVAELIRIGCELAEGLEAAHEKGLLHRDIKPANIWLEHPDGRVKLLDFGLARALAGDANQTGSGVIVGTPAFMSPEQASGQPLDHRSDLFSLGSVLYLMATGQRPFLGNNTLAVLQALAVETPATPRQLRPELPVELSDLIEQLLAKDRSLRPASAGEVAERLRAVSPDTAQRPLVKPDRPAAFLRIALGSLLVMIVCLGGVLSSWDWSPKDIKPAASSVGLSEPHATLPSVPPAVPARVEMTTPAPSPANSPFNTAEAQQHQQAWAKHLGVPVEYTNSIGMRFRLIPPGEFDMGSSPDEVAETLRYIGETDPRWTVCTQSELDRHRVILTRPFYLGMHEITQWQFQTVLAENPSAFASHGTRKLAVRGLDTRLHPVDSANWFDAVRFCLELSRRERLPSAYQPEGDDFTILSGTGYRLPTEAEWEFACRAGTTTPFSSGDTEAALQEVGWSGPNAMRRTQTVGLLPPNPFGLHDMHGNVFEWCQDWLDPQFYAQFRDRPAVDPICLVSADASRIHRGGNWFIERYGCRSGSRSGSYPAGGGEVVGFRVVLPVESVQAALSAVPASVPVADFVPLKPNLIQGPSSWHWGVVNQHFFRSGDNAWKTPHPGAPAQIENDSLVVRLQRSRPEDFMWQLRRMRTPRWDQAITADVKVLPGTFLLIMLRVEPIGGKTHWEQQRMARSCFASRVLEMT